MISRNIPHLTAIQLAFGPFYERADQVNPSMKNTWVAAFDNGRFDDCTTVGDLAVALLDERKSEITG